MKTEVKYIGNTEGELFTSWHYVDRWVSFRRIGCRGDRGANPRHKQIKGAVPRHVVIHAAVILDRIGKDRKAHLLNLTFMGLSCRKD